MKIRIALILLAAVCAAFSCHQPVPPEPGPVEGAVKVYTTNTSGLRFQESSAALGAPEKSDFSVTLTGETFQTVEGFGLPSRRPVVSICSGCRRRTARSS